MGKNKDSSIEFLRIIACFCVICIHISLGNFYNNTLCKSALILACFRADAVAMFWLITGAFYFKTDDYKIIIMRTIKKIVVPMLFITVVVQLFDGCLFQDLSVVDSIRTVNLHSMKSLIKGVAIQWTSPVAHTGHFWYLYVYLLVALFYPVEKAFVDTLNIRSKIRTFAIISAFLLVLNDLSDNVFANFSHHTFGALVPAVILIIWGHFVYKNRERIAQRFKGVVWILLFVMANTYRYIFMLLFYAKSGNLPTAILYWYSACGLAASISMYMFVYCISKTKQPQFIKNIGVAVGSFTFDIYLIHQIVIDLLNKFELIEKFKRIFVIDGSLERQFFYYFVIGISIFVISLILSVVFRIILKLICILVEMIKNRCVIKTQQL